VTTTARPAWNKPPQQRRGGFASLVRTELKLLSREPMLIFWALVFPVGLLVVLGVATPSHSEKSLGGLRFIVVYTPVLMTFTLTMLALSAMPATLASYRDKGYLKRLATTPVGALRLLAAQIVLVFGLSICLVALIELVSRFAFNVPLPGQLLGFVIAILLTIAAMASLGILVAAIAPSQRVAAAAGGLLFFPLMFFAGLWVPQQEMGHTLRTLSQYTPLGAAVPSVESATAGQWPSGTHLLVLAAYTLVLCRLAIRLFRWDR
jgi:ABC-2 type transport system permease protein